VRTFLAFLILVFFGLISGCKQPKDQIIAKAFHQNLYFTEVIGSIPYSESKEDSLIFMEQFIEDWVLQKTLLAYAKKRLTAKEQDFSIQIKKFNEQLLINAYLQKITSDSSLFEVHFNELADLQIEEKQDDTPEYRDMVKLNYIKLSNPSKLYKKIKGLFFDEPDRIKATTQLELLCSDTIEYYLDNERWFYTDFIENELPFTFSGKDHIDRKEKFDFVQDGNRYLVLILDRKQQLQPKNSLENKTAVQLFLQQQKKVEFLRHFQDSLLQKALLDKKVVVFPVNY
jgi:hypothetical protein